MSNKELLITPTEAKKTLKGLQDLLQGSKEEAEIFKLICKFENTSESFPKGELTTLFKTLCDVLKLRNKNLQEKALEVIKAFTNVETDKNIIMNLITTFLDIKQDIATDPKICDSVVFIYYNFQIEDWYITKSLPLFIYIFEQKNFFTTSSLYALFAIYFEKQENIVEFLKYEKIIDIFIQLPTEHEYSVSDGYYNNIRELFKCIKILIFDNDKSRYLIYENLKIPGHHWNNRFKTYEQIFNFESKKLVINFHNQLEIPPRQYDPSNIHYFQNKRINYFEESDGNLFFYDEQENFIKFNTKSKEKIVIDLKYKKISQFQVCGNYLYDKFRKFRRKNCL